MSCVASIKKGNLEPDFQFALSDNGAVDLSGATGVIIRINPPENSPFERTMTIDDAENGLVSFPWQAGDTDDVGEHKAEITVTWTSGETTTYPSNGYIKWLVIDRLVSP